MTAGKIALESDLPDGIGRPIGLGVGLQWSSLAHGLRLAVARVGHAVHGGHVRRKRWICR